MSKWFRDVAASAGVHPDVAWKAEMCLNEAATNIIMYAFEDGARHPIHVEIQPASDAVRMTIVDDGRPFNPLDVAPQPIVESLESAPVGGLGIHVIRSYAQAVSYRRDVDRNVLVLTFGAETESRRQ
jgi:anti-sigma regulatory factor (Ser/Thr protein kinase)